MAQKKRRAVMVTTAHKGVFFGYAEGATTGPQVVLRDARCCLYWPQEQKGFLGLAVDGPKADARVGPPAPRLELRDITSVADVSPVAVKAWESAPWR